MNFKMICSNYEWDRMNDMLHVDDKFNFLQNNLISAFSEAFPLVQKSRKRYKDKKWITHALKTCIRQKNRLYKKKIQNPTLNNINRFKEFVKQIFITETYIVENSGSTEQLLCRWNAVRGQDILEMLT